jgi:prevent-host-death family protein
MQVGIGARRGDQGAPFVLLPLADPGHVVKTYESEEVDLVAVHCGDLGRSYLLPPDLFVGRNTIYLRLGSPRNNQRAALNLAADYEFPGAVAQLAERSDGIRKVRGSIPLSSTAEVSAPPETVAHEVRNRFGLYLERTAAGAEITISRHGRPYARLVPVDLNLAPVAADA